MKKNLLKYPLYCLVLLFYGCASNYKDYQNTDAECEQNYDQQGYFFTPCQKKQLPKVISKDYNQTTNITIQNDTAKKIKVKEKEVSEKEYKLDSKFTPKINLP